ncbi:MAG: 4-(cytidine 5'-diphospho)-2-C-methyl-D-erythritol kinase [Armatimonadia bacterium]
MNSVRVCCSAKINLTLEIIGRRADGYHELRTIFQSVSLSDELVIERGAESRHPTVTMIGSPAPVGMDLCDRAARAYFEATDWRHDVTIGLHKHIPVGAGLGGGSADAAGTLLGLATLHGQPDLESLHDLAAAIGSDVPFFLQGGTALGTGRGECLEPLPPLTEGWLVIAKPSLSVSTREAYGLLRAKDYSDGSRTARCVETLRRGGPTASGCGTGACTPPCVCEQSAPDGGVQAPALQRSHRTGSGSALRELAAGLYNGFARVVEERWPDTRALRERLLLRGAQTAMLSGSGAAVFGVFEDQPTAAAAVAAFNAEGTWAVAAQPTTCGLTVTPQA